MEPAPAVKPPPRSRRQRRRELRESIPLTAAPPSRGPRRTRHEVRRLDLWSVLKMSLLCYVCAVLLVILSLVVAWFVASALGAIDGAEQFIGDLLSADNFTFVSTQILEGAVLVGLVFVAMMTVLTTVAAALYNVFAEMIGGVEVVLVEEEP